MDDGWGYPYFRKLPDISKWPSKSWISSMFSFTKSQRKIVPSKCLSIWPMDYLVSSWFSPLHHFWSNLQLDPQWCTAAAIARQECQLADSFEGPAPTPEQPNNYGGGVPYMGGTPSHHPAIRLGFSLVGVPGYHGKLISASNSWWHQCPLTPWSYDAVEKNDDRPSEYSTWESWVINISKCGRSS